MKCLIFGDSNTWGYCPHSGQPYQQAWPDYFSDQFAALQVIVDAQPGRTTALGSQAENGWLALQNYQNLDALIVMLGTNDLQLRFRQAQAGLRKRLLPYTQVARHTVLIAPVHPLPEQAFSQQFDCSASAWLVEQIARTADESGAQFINANEVVSANPVDGIHWLSEDHRRFGDYLSRQLTARQWLS